MAGETLRARLRWGRDGAAAAAVAGEVVVVVDVLSFSTCVVAACQAGAWVVPCADRGRAAARAERHGARLARRREEAGDGPSLSPPSLASLAPGTGVVLPSPNGSTCVERAAAAPAVWVGALVNAGAVAQAAAADAGARGLDMTVLACGERWAQPGEDGALRVALEDLVGAGAVLAQLAEAGAALDPDARAAVGAFEAVRDDLEGSLLGCPSGVELVERGFVQDVAWAARWNVAKAAPRYQAGLLRSSTDPGGG